MMQAYLGQADLKAALITEIGKHEAADEIAKGTYGSMNGQWRGCAIGCSLRSLNRIQGAEDINARTGLHERFPSELGLPLWLGFLEDSIFEQLPDDLAKMWPRRVMESIPVGAVISDRVLGQILIWVLSNNTFLPSPNTPASCGMKHATNRKDLKQWVDAVSVYIDADSTRQATAKQREAAMDAIDVRDAMDAWVVRDAMDAWVVRDDAWVVRDAMAAWAASNSSRAADNAHAFFQALSEFVLGLLRRSV